MLNWEADYDQYYRESQRLQRELGALKFRLRHEASELKLCLQGEPNLEMATFRVDNILKALGE